MGMMHNFPIPDMSIVAGAPATFQLDPASGLFEFASGASWLPGQQHPFITAPGGIPTIGHLLNEIGENGFDVIRLVAPTGYLPNLAGWNLHPSMDLINSGTQLHPNNHITISPRWTPDPEAGPTNHAITWNLAGGAWPDGFAPAEEVPHGGTIALPAEEPTRAGFTFGGWSPALPMEDVTSAQSFTASWTPADEVHAITWNLAGGAWPDGFAPAEEVPHGGTIGLPAEEPTRAGFTFGGWSPALPMEDVTSAQSFTASWTPQGGSGGGGGIIPPPGGDPDPEYDGAHHAFLVGSAGQVRPHSNITRAEIATIFFRLISDTERVSYWSQTNSFSDVTSNRWFNNAVSTTANMGIFEGIGGGMFAPDQAITRGDLAAVLVRFMNRNGTVNLGVDDQFDDIAGHWARAYINEAARNGWVQGDTIGGVPTGTFRPSEPITRAETAAMINRIFNRVPGSAEDLLPDMITWGDNANVNSWYFLYIQSATNSFTYTREDGSMAWVTIRPARDWRVLERPDSTPDLILQQHHAVQNAEV